MQLYSYYRSSAAYRVRIALNYKALAYEAIPVNLLRGEQLEAAYLTHNPQGRVPLLRDGALEIGQSLAILEYLEEKYPEPSLLPKTLNERAWVRFIANIIACDMHPLNNSGVLRYLKDHLNQDPAEVQRWYHHWLKQGFDALEKLIASSPHAGECCLGDEITLADICLIPQIYNAFRFEFSMDAYPHLLRIYEHCLQLPYFAQAHPEQQPDYVK